jgi:hypothetical protein
VTVLNHGDRDLKVAVIGVGSSDIRPDRTDLSLQEMIFEGTTAVLADARIARTDLDSVILSASDLVDGRGIAGMASAAAAGAYMKHETRTSNDGLYAVALGALEIWSGRSRMTLVMAWNKMSEVKWEMATPAMFEPLFERPIALDDRVARELAANAYWLSREGEEFNADLRQRERMRQSGRMPEHADGAYGLVLAEESVARSLGQPYVLLDAIAWGACASIAARERPQSTGLAAIAKHAYDSANLTRRDQLDVIELSARSDMEENLFFDDLVRPLTYLSGPTAEPESVIALNPSGGFRTVYLMQAAGLMAAGAVVNQLRGRAGATQLKDPHRGVAHGQSGPAAQGNIVAVFSATEESL